MLSINGAAASGTTSPTPSGSVRHHTREHAQLTGNFLGGTGFGSQSPAAGHSNFANSDFSSFLEGVMTEEERRTRTRQLPEVEGFNILSKSEAKADIAVARSWNPAITDPSEILQPPPEDVEESEQGPWVPPNIVSSDEDSPPPSAAQQNSHLMDPTYVESTSSFNPPRPPESSGANKKRRMTRWEKNPSEIEVDLENYRRTVQKTREELLLAESEREKVECVASAIRTHFLHHLRASALETTQLTAETDAILSSLSEIAKAANLEGVNGAILIMKALGEAKGGKDKKKKGRAAKAPPAAAGAPGGIGGVCVSSEPAGESILGVKDAAAPLASAWLLPGDAVRTAYGNGVVDTIMGDYTLKEKAHSGAITSSGPPQTGLIVVPPRVKIKVDYGFLYMMPSEVTSLVRVEELSDAALLERWSNMLNTAPTAGGYVDETAMSMAPGPMGYTTPTGDAELYKPTGLALSQEAGGGSAMQIDAEGGASRLVRFGTAMIPTPGSRGSNLSGMKIQQLRQTINGAVCGRQEKDPGFLASMSSLVLPDSFSEWEEERLEIYKLKGHMLQLKKVVKRLETSKSLSEKALTSAEGHHEKQTATRTEVMSELLSLKAKCAAELQELGISEEEARKVLLSKLAAEAEGKTAPEPPQRKPKRRNKPASATVLAPNRSSKRKRGSGSRGSSKSKKSKEEEDDDDNGKADDDDDEEAAAKKKSKRSSSRRAR
mmetsp:Transcript_17272/g.34642  ORF Transcript_17272/g.34642 Transcript_17272/m.34642 type:complete len:718 (-) Transcript_17272:86-2239(-)